MSDHEFSIQYPTTDPVSLQRTLVQIKQVLDAGMLSSTTALSSTTVAGSLLSDAPVDGKLYGRRNTSWVRVEDVFPGLNIAFDSVADMLNDTTVLTYTSVAVGDRVEAGPFGYFVAAAGASDHHLVTAGGVKLYVDMQERADVKAFGAVGDGTTDDTTAIQAAFNSDASEVFISAGTYLVTDSNQDWTPVFTSTQSDRVIRGPGVFTATSQVFRLLRVTGDRTRVTLNVDGNNNISECIQVFEADGCHVTDCYIHDLNGFTQGAGIAIKCQFELVDCGVTVTNNVIRNMQGVGDGTYGNAIGFQRGIVLMCKADMTKQSMVATNFIEQCEGEEGDAIQIEATDPTGAVFEMPVTVQDNVIRKFTRRGVKVQGNGIKVIGNTIDNTGQTDTARLQGGIDLVSGERHQVIGNVFVNVQYINQIKAWRTGTETALNDTIIMDNTIYGVGSETTFAMLAFAANSGSNLVISGNRAIAPTYTASFLTIQAADKVAVTDNTACVGTSSWYSISSVTNLFMHGNVTPTNASNRTAYIDENGVHVFDITNGKKVRLRNRDTAVSDGEIMHEIAFHQNDNGTDEEVAAIQAIGVGSSGTMKVAIKPGAPSGLGIGSPKEDGIEVDKATSSGVTRLLVYVTDAASLQRVSVGAADSGGTGFRVLRVPN